MDAVEQPKFLVDQERLDHYVDQYLVHVNKKCGGVLIDESQVMTAAHCVSLSRTRFGEATLDPTEVESIAVSHGDQEVGVVRVDIHPDYDSDNPEGSFDLAVLTLSDPLTDAHMVSTITAPDQLLSGQTYLLLARNSGAREVLLSNCPDDLGGSFYSYASAMFRCVHHTALSHAGTCVGDSGSPIIALDPRTESVALVTIHHAAHTLEAAPASECRRGGDSHEYGVALMVAAAQNWLPSLPSIE